MDMKLLFYAPVGDAVGERLRKMIEALVPEGEREMCRTLDALSRMLLQPKYDLGIVVLLASTREELWKLLSIRDLLDDVRIVLVLPDREDDTITKGHILRPRFVTYTDGNFVDIAAVINKMRGSTHCEI
jgi:hypothetical protein